MTDPEKRNIKDERYHRDAAQRYVEATEPPRTHAEWLAHFKEQFDGLFIVTAPEAPGAQWRAVPTFSGSALFEWSATELLAEMRDRQCKHDQERRLKVIDHIDNRLRDADETDES
jgi:hypothetical protein